MLELLKLLRHENQLKIKKLSHLIPRQLQVPILPSKIKVVIGMRRTGKTYYLFEKIQKLINSGIDYSNILYLNLEDDRLQQMNAKQLAELVDQFYALYPSNHHQHCYLFFDEVQVVDDWARFIRRLHDTKDVDIYLTGSSAKLLSREIATQLRGRSVAYEMWPFSLKEYLFAKNTETKELKSKIDLDSQKKHLEHYLIAGGFPEVTVLALPEKNRILQDYVDVVIYKDIVERYHITNLSLMKYLIKYLVRNVGTSISVNKLFNDLKSQGYAVGRSTVYEYLQYVNDAYLAFVVPMFSESVRKTQSNPRKIYAIDTGLSKAYTLSRSSNIGRLFENMIYLDLRRRGDEVHFYQTNDGYEVDFYTRTIEGETHLYQVAWETDDPKTLAREERALRMAEKELGVKGTIITPEIYLSNGEFF